MAAPGTYIIRRGATLVFRRRVPSCVTILYRKSFFAFSLRTHLIAEGRRRAAIARRFTDDLIGLIEVCGAEMREERDMEGVIDDLMRFEVEAVEALRETCGPRSAEAVAAAIQVHEATRDTLRAALIYNDYGAVHAPLDRTLTRLGLAIDPQTDSYRRLARRCARALVEVAEENIRRENGVYRSDFRTIGLTAANAHCHLFNPPRQVPLPPPPGAPTVTTNKVASSNPERPHEPHLASAPAAPRDVTPASGRSLDRAVPKSSVGTGPADGVTASRPIVRRAGIPGDPFHVDISQLDESSPFSDWFAAAITEKREENPGWVTNSLGNWKSTRKLLVEALGDLPVSEYTNRMMLEFRSILQATSRWRKTRLSSAA
ncbi:DUF6538 domain-containing protein [Paracoccus zeaxanthinifaciens]|uniref:DUF6538 domain-containing protein n=1 Tax=Paracoccus zeaxanthinifaciens TaxID=187400 RepID=UPI0003B657A4|nr:DUF6538 domain-containing protein [Paracoccus zeaxanthinifaciens]